MSVGKEQQKTRGNKVAHGWEEAGGEFYQESFPTDLDGAVITRDPTAIATLLPSKQNRAGKYFLSLKFDHCFQFDIYWWQKA